jgi:polar amino acid transport system substrate-binding protein
MTKDKKPYHYDQLERSTVRNTVEIIALYLTIGILWIFLSDLILGVFIQDPELIEDLQLVKGISYVLLTGYLFYIIIKKRMDLYAMSIDDLKDVVTKLQTTNQTLTSLEDKLYKLAYYDELTGLLSRNMIVKHVTDHIEKDPDTILGFIYLDIDDFKNINELKGHEIGDQLIKMVAEEIKTIAGSPHIVGRLSGDEFVVLITNQLHRQQMIELIRRNASHIRKSFMLDDEEFFVSVSAGISIYPDDGKSYNDLLKAADMALNIAKQRGKNQMVIYSNAFNETLHKHTEISNLLYQAIRNQEFKVHFQPIVNSTDYKASSVEALIRWYHPTKGLIPPLEFIDVAEKTGHIKDITWFVIKESFKQHKLWQKEGFDLDISINISPRVLNDPNLVPELKEAIKKHDADPSRCIFEITESAVLEHLDETIVTLQQLRELGIKIALDDFGSGYSSLTYLQRLPIDILKIDRSFIKTLTKDSESDPMLKFIIELAHYMNLKVVSEGIEYDHQKQILSKLKSDFQQGYYFSRPNLADELDKKIFKCL